MLGSERIGWAGREKVGKGEDRLGRKRIGWEGRG